MKNVIMKLVMTMIVLTFAFGAFAREGVFASSGNHNAEGIAKVATEASGLTILMLKNFTTDIGPDVEVYLSKGLWPQDIINLGDIKAFSGDQEYILPAGANLSEYTHVLIWCAEFDILFGSAKL